MGSLRVLVLFAHPALHRSRVNRRLFEALDGLEGVRLHDLYEQYPNLLIDPDREQALLVAHDAVVFQHPFYWYSSPSIIKEWQDIVLEHGFAYGDGGTALTGKWWLSAITTGGPAEAYRASGLNRFSLDELLRPFEQTAFFCGMKFLPPFVTHDTFELSEEEIARAAENYRVTITNLRDGGLTP